MLCGYAIEYLLRLRLYWVQWQDVRSLLATFNTSDCSCSSSNECKCTLADWVQFGMCVTSYFQLDGGHDVISVISHRNVMCSHAPSEWMKTKCLPRVYAAAPVSFWSAVHCNSTSLCLDGRKSQSRLGLSLDVAADSIAWFFSLFSSDEETFPVSHRRLRCLILRLLLLYHSAWFFMFLIPIYFASVAVGSVNH